ncbi:MAG: rRNA pseudouridine synthase [Alphaproteobacteria bacterium]|nr:rRNA pseudouridine synthase [Alphaproteobacteria bacterium]
MRIAKKIAESGTASRREAERLIAEGRVRVNGEVVTTPVFFVDDSHEITHEITIDGKPIGRKSEKLVVWKMNKPKGYITTKRDPKGRKTVFDLFPKTNDRLLYIGRLDYNSEGLLLFTNDGNFSRKLELPTTGLSRSYKVRFHGNLTKEKIEKLKNGVIIDGINYGPIDAKIIKQDKSNNWAILTLREGKNREIRKVLESLDCIVNRLIRISYGTVSLGPLPSGKIEKLSENEVRKLVKAADKSEI